MHKTGKIIFVGGVHGVGKSTFASMIKSKNSQIDILSCSDIIKWENSAHKEVENVGETQNKLLRNLPFFIDQDINYIMDGHFFALELITEFQRKEIKYAKEVADTLGVPLEECNSTNRKNVILSVLGSF